MYYTEEKENVLQSLKTDMNGLSPDEAAVRLERDGANEITEGKRKGVLRVFLSQFADLLVLILIASALISVFTGNAESAIVIVCVITLNAVLGTVQHFKAEKSLDSLKAMSSPVARVMRGGTVYEIPAREVCVGDIMLLEAGNIATADGRIVEAASLMSNESSLTGESCAVEKNNRALSAQNGKDIMLADRVNMIYSGSQITSGRGVIAVTETGMNTEIGKIAALINNTQKKKTPLQKSLDNFSKWLSIIILIVCAVVMALSMLRGVEVMDALMFAVALAVAAIPEALSSIVTISLAIGTQKMARENAIIKDLKAVEGLGCVSIICSDKTGTLTQNRMTVREIYTEGKTEKTENVKLDEKRLLFLSMVLCNDAMCGAECAVGDPTETALLDLKSLCLCRKERELFPRLSELPFDSDRKLMSTLHNIDEKTTMLTKGATDVLLDRLEFILENGAARRITEADLNRIKSENKRFSKNGMRVLCFASKQLEAARPLELSDEDGVYTFIGLAAMTDPPRAESAAAVADCKKAGIKPIMITGDHKITATAIAREIGIYEDGDLALDGSELESISDEKLTELLPKISVYARVSPAHKIRIVTLWQSLGHIAAMTGDGVNDAPALKKADVGVAMGITGTQVSKDAASMILTDDNFATIIKSVANGRTIYQNIKNAVKFLISGNTAGIITVLYTVLLGLSMPFTAVHLLFINLLTDSLPAIAISMEPADGDVMKRRPRKSSAGILDRKMICSILMQAVLLAAATIMSYHIGLAVSAGAASTMAFSTLCLARLFGGFNCRGEKPVTRLGFMSNPFSIIAFLAGVLFLSAALFIPPLYGLLDIAPLNASQLLFVLGLSFAPTLIIQIFKAIRYRRG